MKPLKVGDREWTEEMIRELLDRVKELEVADQINGHTLAQQQAKIAHLRKALEKHGKHDDACSFSPDDRFRCYCGLSEILKEGG